jgi:hypothetical protein
VESNLKIIDSKDKTTLKLRELANKRLEHEGNIAKIIADREKETAESRLDEEKRVRDYLYDRTELDPQQYYKEEMAAIKARYDLEYEAAKRNFDNWVAINKEKEDLAIKNIENNPQLFTEYLRERVAQYEEMLSRLSKADEKSFSDTKEMARKSLRDLANIFSRDGLTGVLSKVAEDMSKVWGNVAENIKNSFETVMNTLESELEGIFDNLMEGIIDWEKAVISVLKTITKEIIKTFTIKPFMEGLPGVISEKLKPKEGEQPGFWSKLFGATGTEGKGGQEVVATKIDETNRILREIQTGTGFAKEKSPLDESPIKSEATEVLGETTESCKEMNQELKKTPSLLDQFMTGIGDFMKYIWSLIKGAGEGIGEGLGSLFGKLFGSGSGGGELITPGVGVPYMAKGGKVSLNRAYIVGEKGPELFSPNTNGTIIPNGAFGGSPTLNSTVNVINNTKTPVNARQGEVKFDGKEYIVNVVLDEITNNYGPLRHAVRGVR